MDSVLEIFPAGDATSDYLRAEGLDRLLAGARLPAPDGDALAPDLEDLARLHRLVRERRAFTVLEFGVGYSTLVLAHALSRNADAFAASDAPVALLPADAFCLFAVDASRAWIDVAAARLPNGLKAHVRFCHSPVIAGTFAGQLCHYYRRLPDAVPDFIYLDGPDPRDVAGAVHGLGFAHRERTPLAADLLLLEPTFVPGLMIVVDGRTNNARFLRHNFKRRYEHYEDPDGRYTSFELAEPPLGPRNRALLDYCGGGAG